MAAESTNGSRWVSRQGMLKIVAQEDAYESTVNKWEKR